MIKTTIRNEAEELLDNLRDMIYEKYIKGMINKLSYQDMSKIDNDLGYIVAAVDNEEDFDMLVKYKDLISQYKNQLK